MKKEFVGMIVVSAIAGMSLSAGSFAQSEAQSEAFQAIREPLDPGSGIASIDDYMAKSGGGQSVAMSEAQKSIRQETDEVTSIPNAEALDELSSEGHSDAAAEAIASQWPLINS